MAKKRTQAQTPAPKKDRVKGSAKNPKGSASGSRGSISISDKTEKALVNLRNKHNDKYKSLKKRVDLGMLKAVYRRGSGAYSVSHRPNVTSRDQWALGRVKAFLKLVGTGERKKAYTGDLDLLPKGHPQKSDAKAEATALALPQKYSHIDFKPPKGAQEAAARALKKRAEKPPSQRGMTPTGLARARDLANGRTVSPETARRMLSYFQRHEVDKQGSTWDEYGKGRQAWDGWGGNSGFSFARKVVKQMNTADKKTQSLRAYGEAILLNDSSSYEVPEGLTVGKPFKTLSLGQVSSRLSGDQIGKPIDKDLLIELVRVFNEYKSNDPVIIDWQHATSPFHGSTPAPPETGNALGMIIDLDIKDDGLYAVPAYNERGLEVVKNAGGVLWSSPEYIHGDIFSRQDGSKLGEAQLLAITLTPRPAQSNNTIDRITLTEGLNMDDQIKELQAKLEAKDALVKKLEDQLAEMKKDNDSKLMAEEEDKEERAESYEDKQAMAEEDKKDEDEDKIKKMSESFNSSNVALLNEVQALKEQLNTVVKENNSIKCDKAVDVLLSEGKITPNERSFAVDAWHMKDLQPTFWQMFSERPAGKAVPLTEIGHGASGQEISKATLSEKIKSLASEKQITFSEALNLVREQDPVSYRKAYGV